MKKFFGEFKKFITRGNVLDMAVGVIVGGAFTGIVNGLSNNVLKPIINWLLSLVLGKEGLSGAITMLSPSYVDGVLDLASSIYIDWGAFISSIINFLLIAFVLFVIVKTMNSINEGIKERNKELKELYSKEMLELRKQGKSRKEIKKILRDRKVELENQKKREAEEAKKNAPPTTDELLTQILEELKKSNNK
ncbi:MAG: large conductance mechanosensitive channel protein MscL [Clostridiales bacterium]|nr:large conductance mechanosensitive channel protein MscL [Clostridiales bacterium]